MPAKSNFTCFKKIPISNYTIPLQFIIILKEHKELKQLITKVDFKLNLPAISLNQWGNILGNRLRNYFNLYLNYINIL